VNVADCPSMEKTTWFSTGSIMFAMPENSGSPVSARWFSM
jgi:hypothetical protein